MIQNMFSVKMNNLMKNNVRKMNGEVILFEHKSSAVNILKWILK